MKLPRPATLSAGTWTIRTSGAKSRPQIRDLDRSPIKMREVAMTLAGSGVRLFVLYSCPAGARRKLQSRIVEEIWSRFQSDPRAEIAFPHMEFAKYEPQHAPRPKAKRAGAARPAAGEQP